MSSHSLSFIEKGAFPSIMKLYDFFNSSFTFIKRSTLYSHQYHSRHSAPLMATLRKNSLRFLANLTVRLLKRKLMKETSARRNKLIYYYKKSMQRPPLQPTHHYTGDLKKDNEHLHRELAALKVELYGVYEENLRMRDMLKDQERDRQLVRECETELSRLKGMLKEVTEKRDAMPSEREEIKDRIIMKLEDELISAKIELKEAHLQLHKLTRMQ